MAKRFVKRRRDYAVVRSVLTPVVSFLVIIALFNLGMRNLSQASGREQQESTRRAVVNATVQCYALEGQFPSSVDYLKEHYGLQVDTDKYIVDYGFMAGNMMPEITVLPRFFASGGAALPRELVDSGVFG